MQIKEIMSRDVVTISSEESVAKAALLMRDKNVGTVAVTDGDRLIGLLNDRQIAVGGVAAGKDPRKIRAGDVMSKKVVTGTPDMDILDAAKIMGKLHFRRLPVINRERRLQGMVSICDLSRPLRQFSDSILDELSKTRPEMPEEIERPKTPQWMFT